MGSKASVVPEKLATASYSYAGYSFRPHQQCRRSRSHQRGGVDRTADWRLESLSYRAHHAVPRTGHGCWDRREHLIAIGSAHVGCGPTWPMMTSHSRAGKCVLAQWCGIHLIMSVVQVAECIAFLETCNNHKLSLHPKTKYSVSFFDDLTNRIRSGLSCSSNRPYVHSEQFLVPRRSLALPAACGISTYSAKSAVMWWRLRTIKVNLSRSELDQGGRTHVRLAMRTKFVQASVLKYRKRTDCKLRSRVSQQVAMLQLSSRLN